jgi:hypothetical protein
MHRKLMLLFAVALATCAGGFAQDTPHIVKRFHLYNQSGAIGPITIYTPKVGHGGMFRVNTFIVTTVGNGGDADVCGYLGFTDRIGYTQILAMTSSCPSTKLPGYVGVGTIPIPDEGGKPLTLQIYTFGDTSGAKYDVTIIVEEL